MRGEGNFGARPRATKKGGDKGEVSFPPSSRALRASLASEIPFPFPLNACHAGYIFTLGRILIHFHDWSTRTNSAIGQYQLYAMLMSPNEEETAVLGCLFRGYKVVRMGKVLAILRRWYVCFSAEIGILIPLTLSIRRITPLRRTISRKRHFRLNF